MNRFQWLLSLVVLALICFEGVKAKNDSSGSSESGSNESGSGAKKHHKKANNPQPPAPGPYPNYYNHPVYQPPMGSGGYYLPPNMPYYGYGQGYQQPQGAPMFQPGYAPYPYGGYYNQPPLPSVQGPQVQQQDSNQGPQGFAGIPGGSSTINHSLKVNKEYKEDGHHYKPDGTVETSDE